MFGIVLDELTKDDYQEEKQGIKFVVNEDILNNFGSFQIDYISNFFRKGFVVSSEYGSGSC